MEIIKERVFEFINLIHSPKALSLLFVLLLMAAIPLITYVVQQQHDIRSKAAVTSNPKSPDVEKPEYVAGEVLVKLRTQMINVKTKEGKGIDLDKESVAISEVDEESIPSILTAFNQKYKIKTVEKVFKGAEDPQKELNKIKSKFSKEISEGKRKINEQEFLKIDLSRTYKLSFDPKIPVESVIDELSQNPEVEYAEPNYKFKTFSNFGNAARFEIGKNYIEQYDLYEPPLRAPISIEAWIKFNNEGRGTIFYQRGGYWRNQEAVDSALFYLFAANNSVTFIQNDFESPRRGSVIASYNFVIGQWYHIAAVSDAQTVKIYINGEERASSSIVNNDQTIITSWGYYVIQNTYDSDAGPLTIDELRMSSINRNITDNWNQGIYFNPLIVDDNTYVLFHFNEQNGATFVTDDARGNNGRIFGTINFVESDISTPSPTTTPQPTITPQPTPSIFANDPYFLDPDPPAPERNISAFNSWDPNFDYQWNLKKIKVQNAWDIATGSAEVKIAIPDTGIDYTHEDLETLSIIKGKDYVNNDQDPIDDNGHGTHVAGIIAATTNNNEGIAGINHKATLITEKFLDQWGNGKLDDGANAVIDAVSVYGADIINMSWGCSCKPKVLSDALDFAYNSGVTLIAAAGNSFGADVRYMYPASHDKVIAVSATDPNDRRADYSNIGSGIDVAAPGGSMDRDLLSLRAHDPSNPSQYLDIGYPVNHGYTRLAGTSMAAPHVAGLSALIINHYQKAYATRPSPKEIENIIKNSADDLGDSGFDVHFGFGRINAFKAVSEMDTRDVPYAKIVIPSELESLGRGRYKLIGAALGEPFENYSLSWKWEDEEENQWKQSGIELVNEGKTPVKNGVLGYWSLKNITPRENQKRLNLKLEVRAREKALSDRTTIYFNPYLREGFPLFFPEGTVYNPIPIIADIDQDRRKELIYAVDKFIQVYSENGTHLLNITRDKSISLYPADLSIPSVGDISSAPGLEIAGFMADYDQYGNYQTKIAVWDKTGQLVPGWPKTIKTQFFNNYQGPVLADLDKDGKQEVIFPDYSRNYDDPIKLYVLKGDGSDFGNFPVILPNQPNRSIVSIPRVADVNGDGNLEIVLSYCINRGSEPYCIESFLIYDKQAQILSGWPKNFNNYMFGNFLLGDINQDSKAEIVISEVNDRSDAGGYYTYSGNLHIFNGNGTELSNWPKSFSGFIDDHLIMSDLTGDKKPEIIALNLDQTPYIDNSKWLIYDSWGNLLPGFTNQENTTIFPFDKGAVIGDVDNDNHKEIFGFRFNINFSDRALALVKYNRETKISQFVSPYPYIFSGGDYSALADLDSDGKTELISGRYVFNTDKLMGKLDWPQYLHDERHTGAYIRPVPSPSPTPTATPTPIPCTACRADIDQDGLVRIVDFSRLSSCFNKSALEDDSSGRPCAPSDLDGNGRVEMNDFSCLQSKFGQRCQ